MFSKGSSHNCTLHDVLLVESRAFIRGRTVSITKRQGVLVTCSAEQVDSDNGPEENKGEQRRIDWDKDWSSFAKKKRGPFLSKFDMEKYVTRSPQHSKYPLSEETDSFRRTEKSTLGFWTDTKFTIAGLVVIVVLFIYMVLIVGAPPLK